MIRIVAKRNLPVELTGGKIDRVERSPGRRITRQPVMVPDAEISGKRVALWGTWLILLGFRRTDVAQHTATLDLAELGKARHATASFSNDRDHLHHPQSVIDVDQTRAAIRAFAVNAMTKTAMLCVHVPVAETHGDLVQANDSGYLLGIQNESIAVRIEGRAAPLRTAIVGGIHQRAFESRWRPRSSFQILDFVLHEIDRLLIAVGNFESLASKRDNRLRLCRRGSFFRQVAWKCLDLFYGINRLSGVSVKYV